MPVAKTLLTLAAAACVLAANAAPSQAATTSHRDAAKDVLSRSLYSDASPTKPEPAHPLGDILKTTISYGTDLVVTTKFRSLRSTLDEQFSWFILPSDGDSPGYWTALLGVSKGKDKGDFTILDPIANQPRCGSAVLDRAARTATLTIPGSCLGDPRWVKVSLLVQMWTASGPGTREYADDAFRDGVFTQNATYSPKVRRS
jgi:hypothetical protein